MLVACIESKLEVLRFPTLIFTFPLIHMGMELSDGLDFVPDPFEASSCTRVFASA